MYLLCRTDPLLEDDIPDLLPVLRPYQRRAAYWMVQQEKGDSGSFSNIQRNHFHFPLCIPVGFLDSSSKMFYNPFRYWEGGYLRHYFFINVHHSKLVTSQLHCLW